MGDDIFGRISVAVVTPFVDASIDEEQPIDWEGFSSVISHVSAGLEKVSENFVYSVFLTMYTNLY